jgi:hypothetical protein
MLPNATIPLTGQSILVLSKCMGGPAPNIFHAAGSTSHFDTILIVQSVYKILYTYTAAL